MYAPLVSGILNRHFLIMLSLCVYDAIPHLSTTARSRGTCIHLAKSWVRIPVRFANLSHVRKSSREMARNGIFDLRNARSVEK